MPRGSPAQDAGVRPAPASDADSNALGASTSHHRSSRLRPRIICNRCKYPRWHKLFSGCNIFKNMAAEKHRFLHMDQGLQINVLQRRTNECADIDQHAVKCFLWRNCGYNGQHGRTEHIWRISRLLDPCKLKWKDVWQWARCRQTVLGGD